MLCLYYIIFTHTPFRVLVVPDRQEHVVGRLPFALSVSLLSLRQLQLATQFVRQVLLISGVLSKLLVQDVRATTTPLFGLLSLSALT